MLVEKRILVWKNAPSLEELLPLVCDDRKTIEAELTEMVKMKDGLLVDKSSSATLTLTLAQFSMEHEDRCEGFPVALRADVKKAVGHCSIGAGDLSDSLARSTVYLLYHPGYQLAVVEQFSWYRSMRYDIPPDAGCNEKSDRIYRNFMVSLGLPPEPEA